MNQEKETKTNRGALTLTVEPHFARQMRKWLRQKSRQCGFSVDHLASVLLLDAIEERMIAQGEGRFAPPTSTTTAIR